MLLHGLHGAVTRRCMTEGQSRRSASYNKGCLKKLITTIWKKCLSLSSRLLSDG
jgi:hypothetical protein